MAVIGELATLVTARTAPFEKSMKRVRSSTKQTVTGIQGFGAALKNFALGPVATAVAGVATLTAGLSSMRQVLSDLDALAKRASKIGIDVNQLRALEIGASRAGIQTSELERSLVRMQRTLGDAAAGSGEAADAFGRLGLSVDELLQLSPEMQFLRIAEAIQAFGTQAERQSATADVFGRSGQNLVRVFGLGEQGLSAIRQEMDRFGLTISENLGKTEQLNDDIETLKGAWQGLKEGIATALVETFSPLADTLKSWGLNLRTVGKMVVDLSNKLNPLVQIIKKLQEVGALLGIGGEATAAGTDNPALRSALADYEKRNKAYRDALRKQRQADHDARRAAAEQARIADERRRRLNPFNVTRQGLNPFENVVGQPFIPRTVTTTDDPVVVRALEEFEAAAERIVESRKTPEGRDLGVALAGTAEAQRILAAASRNTEKEDKKHTRHLAGIETATKVVARHFSKPLLMLSPIGDLRG